MRTVQLGQLVDDVAPGFASGENTLDGTMQVRMNNVGTDGSMNWHAVRRVPVPNGKLKRYELRDGDVLFNSTNSPELVGKTALFDGATEPVVYSNHFFRIRPSVKQLDSRYLHRYLNHLWGRKVFENLCTRWVNQAAVRKDDLLQIEIPLPPLKEQKRIAAILDKADALRRKRAQALQLTDQFLQSLFLDMFGDPVTNPMGWETKKFGDRTVGTLDRGRSRHRPRNAPELLGGPYPLIQTGEVANCRRYITTHSQSYSELGLKQSKMWPAGTLCITIAANIAKTGILRFDACFPDSVVGYAPAKGMRTEYVQSWMSFLQRILEENAPESAQKNINLRILGELDIPVPDENLQNKFAEIVKKVEQTSLKHTASAADIEALSSSLAVDAFRGEL